MSWAQRRKATYISGILLFLAIVTIFFSLIFFSKKATCTDGIKNQNEVGVDCGGPCTNLCRAEYVNIESNQILWVRTVKVLSSGTYNLLAYVENPNVSAGAYDVPYYFKIYDKDNVLLFEGSGKTYIPPSKNFAVFEDGIDIRDKIPARISFEFSKEAVWQNMENRELGIVSLSRTISKEDTNPRVDAVLKNKTLQSIKDIEVIAVLYDSDDNAIAFSKSKIDSLGKEESQDVIFTWPEPFGKKVYKIEIISKILGK